MGVSNSSIDAYLQCTSLFLSILGIANIQFQYLSCSSSYCVTNMFTLNQRNGNLVKSAYRINR